MSATVTDCFCICVFLRCISFQLLVCLCVCLCLCMCVEVYFFQLQSAYLPENNLCFLFRHLKMSGILIYELDLEH